MVVCKITLLDGHDFNFHLDKKALGSEVFNKVVQKLELRQADYFCCTFKDSKGVMVWLSNDKKVTKQIEDGPWEFYFQVKFYPPDPSAINDELTRYQIFLQLRTDVLRGKLPCSFLTLALLGSFAAQSELGDYDPGEHGSGIEYLKKIHFAPNQTDELLDKIAELHRTHRGETPAEAEMEYLENAKKLSLYGVHIHYAKELDGSDVQIGVCAAGLLIYKDRLRIHRFTWPKILKFAYKRNNFTIKNRPGESDDGILTHEYKLVNFIMAKRLWKLAVEHHSFFRLRATEPGATGIFGRFGPHYRMPPRTHYQIQEGAGAGNIPPQRINRAPGRLGYVHSMENVNGGNTTERKEQFEPNRSTTATLDLKNRRQGSAPMLDNWDDPAGQGMGPYGYGTGVTYASEASGNEYELGGGQFMTNASGAHSETGSRGMRGAPVGDAMYDNRSPNQFDSHYQRIGDVHGGEQFGAVPDWASNRSSVAHSVDRGANNGYYNGDGRGGGPGSLHPSQYDRLHGERGYNGDGMGGEYDGGMYNSGTVGKTTTRTYTDEDGNIVTEYRTERHGVIETRVEKRQRIVSSGYRDDMDYDKALGDAILAVTNVNTDLSVEKIEIQTTEDMDDDTGPLATAETLISNGPPRLALQRYGHIHDISMETAANLKNSDDLL